MFNKKILQYFQKENQDLYVWGGVIQSNMVKTLYSNGDMFPDDIRMLPDYSFAFLEPISAPNTFVFRFKSTNGFYYNAFCLLDQTSFQLKQMVPNQQCVICIISFYFHFEAFEEILTLLRSILLRNVSHASKFLETYLYNISSITSIESKLTSSPHQLYFVFSKISPINLAQILVAILCDISIIIVSSDLNLLSRFCFALLSSIRPLEWKLLFIPILPSSLFETLQSPSPYIVGLHSSLFDKIQSIYIDDHVLINIDDNILEYNSSIPLPKWVVPHSNLLSNLSQKSIGFFIINAICSALGVQPSNSAQVTAKRILSAKKQHRFDNNSFESFFIASLTLKSFFLDLNRNEQN